MFLDEGSPWGQPLLVLLGGGVQMQAVSVDLGWWLLVFINAAIHLAVSASRTVGVHALSNSWYDTLLQPANLNMLYYDF